MYSILTRFFLKKVFFLFFLLTIILLAGFNSFFSVPSHGEGTYANIGTADSADGSNDAINFSQGRVWTIDKYGKYIWITQPRGGNNHWVWSNNLGANWTQGSESYIALTRASVAYDSINDKLHVIWTATDSNDGIIYRRYGITRDGSNNITAISREDSSNINLQLDTSSSRTVEQALALWVNDGSANGSLVAIWSKNGNSMAEIRGSMRHLSLSAADGVAGNWTSLDGSTDTFLTDPPLVASDKIFTATTGSAFASANIRGGNGSRKNDVYVFVAGNQNTNNNIYAYRGIWNTGSTNWSGGWQSPVTVGAMDNNSGGYSLKQQLITKPVLDTANDRLYVGWARWKTGGAGDTVSFAYLNSVDAVSSTVDVYSANGTHSYAPTLDVAFDDTLGLLYVAYIESTTNGDNGSIDYKSYDGTTLSGSTRFYTSPGGTAGTDGSADIPILYDTRSANGRLLFGFRVNGGLPPSSGDPHKIYWGYVTLPTPTPTPTATPIPSATPTTAPVVSGSGSHDTFVSTTEPKSCDQQKPGKKPWLYAVLSATTSAVDLYFTDSGDPYNHYVVEYGTSSGKYIYAADNLGKKGTRIIRIDHLASGVKYYFRVRAGNGCQSGEWSNELGAKPILRTYSK